MNTVFDLFSVVYHLLVSLPADIWAVLDAHPDATVTALITAIILSALGAFAVADARRQRHARQVTVDALRVTRLADQQRNALADEQLGLYRAWAVADEAAGRNPLGGGHVQVIPVIRPVQPVGFLSVEYDPHVIERADVVDERTAEVLAATDLDARDLDGVAEAVAPGVGSVVSLSSAVGDTKARTTGEIATVRAAELEAYAAIEDNEVRLLLSGFDKACAAAFARLDRMQAAAGHWSYYLHDDERADCPHCAEAVREHSNEFRAIVERVEMTDTGAFSTQDLAELRGRLAAAPA